MPSSLPMKPSFQLSSSIPCYPVPSHSTLASPLSLSTLHHLPTKTHLVPSLSFSKRPTKPTHLSSFSPSFNSSINPFEDEDDLLGDCVVFEDGVFQDPFPQIDFPEEPPARKPVMFTENLVPEEWRETQEEINMTKKERRRIAQELEFGSKVEKRNVNEFPDATQYLAYRALKLSQLKPVVLDTPEISREISVDEEDDGEMGHVGVDGNERGVENGELGCSSSGRVVPRNPRLKVAGSTFEAITELFNNDYVPREDNGKNTQGPRKLFTKEEKVLLNKRIPNLTEATSRKWLPVHTLAASGQFYLLDLLLKHNVDINAVDKDGLTALHKAILCKKQAVTNYLLRESANPFIRDKDGATLMHYAVEVASVQTIKILLLYNVDINLSDNFGWTPLHLAVQTRRTDVVRLLLIKGADRTLKNQDGLTPLDICLYSGRYKRTYELIKLLKELHK